MRAGARLCVGMGAILAFAFTLGCAPRESARPERPVPVVAVVTMKPESVVLTTLLPGRTVSCRVAEIRPQVSGLILRRRFKEGSDVKAGQVLYDIDPAPFKAAVENVTANLEAARKEADRARAAVAVSTAAIAKQQATLALAKTNRQRMQDLLRDRAVSASDRDQAVTNVEVAEASLEAARAQVKSDKAAVATADAAIQQAKAALDLARINLGYTEITAPISGRIGPSAVTDGATVTAYQLKALATIQQLDPIYVDVPQSTAELARLRKELAGGRLRHTGTQNQVKLRLEDGTLYSETGTLEFRDVTVDPSTGSVILRMVFPNPDDVLLPGMFVRAVLVEGVDDKAIFAPQQGVTRDPRGRPEALVVDKTGTVVLKPLTLDRAIGARWLVTSGLQAGDRVIVEGLQRIRPGAKVKVVPAKKGAKQPPPPSGASPTRPKHD